MQPIFLAIATRLKELKKVSNNLTPLSNVYCIDFSKREPFLKHIRYVFGKKELKSSIATPSSINGENLPRSAKKIVTVWQPSGVEAEVAKQPNTQRRSCLSVTKKHRPLRTVLFLELITRFELVTSSLPRTCSIRVGRSH